MRSRTAVSFTWSIRRHSANFLKGLLLFLFLHQFIDPGKQRAPGGPADGGVGRGPVQGFLQFLDGHGISSSLSLRVISECRADLSARFFFWINVTGLKLLHNEIPAFFLLIVTELNHPLIHHGVRICTLHIIQSQAAVANPGLRLSLSASTYSATRDLIQSSTQLICL